MNDMYRCLRTERHVEPLSSFEIPPAKIDLGLQRYRHFDVRSAMQLQHPLEKPMKSPIMKATIRNQFLHRHQLTHQRLKKGDGGPSRVEDLRRKTDDVIEFFVWRTDQRKTEIPLDTKMTNVLCRYKVRLSKVNCEAQLYAQTNEKVSHA